RAGPRREGGRAQEALRRRPRNRTVPAAGGAPAGLSRHLTPPPPGRSLASTPGGGLSSPAPRWPGRLRVVREQRRPRGTGGLAPTWRGAPPRVRPLVIPWRETPMSVAQPHSPPLPPTTPERNEVKVISHSTLFYWWPVWAVGFLMALLT